MIEKRALLIHYPSGGFGHYMNALLTTCSHEFHVPSADVEFSSSGDSHAFELNAAKWTRDLETYVFEPAEWAQGSHKRHIVLVDLGIDNDSHSTVRTRFPNNQLIRMCIDRDARSIVNQTCRFKAERQEEFDFLADNDWERREEVSKMYHYCDSNPDYYLNNFQPVVNDDLVLNLPISWLFFNFEPLLKRIESFLDIYIHREKANALHQQFMQGNSRYAQAVVWSRTVMNSLNSGGNTSLDSCSNLHDQGFINYVLEQHYELKEIPPWDYRDWFKNTEQIAQAIERLKNEKETVNH